ncbi:Coenzyme F420 hydrogenase/dehydrogenase, beta subunit C-terminal domain [Catenibacterium sp. GCM10023432]|uniref:Coenzyme F420 hydrogenase/dehydrogenase, beta subunit C-terminal domain n=1 Tax=Catenibacterium sp. GCM10023432 TaxID=3252638 RepID=UPI00361658BB
METIQSIKEECTGCSACYSICPKNAIEMKKNLEGFYYPIINNSNCISCGLCLKVCPVNKHVEINSNNQVYSSYIKDKSKRLESASGGIFRILAEYIIDQKGFVFGAAFDENFKVKHICVDNKNDLKKLLGSKYVQSQMNDSFKHARELLEKGNKVLFVGTGCQIAGLKNYLIKEYDNLLTIDLICHGVPSPSVWEKYIKEKGKGNIIDIIPRDKTNGINDAPIVFKYSNGLKQSEAYSKNIYLRGFIANYYLRNSCYKCNFKGLSRISDITIGDFWGLDKLDQTMYQPYGTSIMITHNNKIDEYIDEINKEMVFKSYPNDFAYKYNDCLINSTNKPFARRIYFLFNHFFTTEFYIKLLFRISDYFSVFRLNLIKIIRKFKLIIKK